MARTQSLDYDKRCEAIVNQAAKLFAKRGFLGASVADLAKACRTSKSLVYHYFPSKEDVLYAVMSVHLDDLAAISEASSTWGLVPELSLRRLTVEFMQAYVGASAHHKVLLNELDNLPPSKRKSIVSRQHEIILLVERLIIDIKPEIADYQELKRPLSMIFFGMINWTHTWFSPKGLVSPESFATIVVEILLNGLHEIDLLAQAS